MKVRTKNIALLSYVNGILFTFAQEFKSQNLLEICYSIGWMMHNQEADWLILKCHNFEFGIMITFLRGLISVLMM